MQSQSASSSLKVFLAEDSGPIRERVAAALVAHHMEVVGEGATPAACIAGILSSHPDVVVLDIHLQGGTGLQVLKAVRAAGEDAGFVILSNTADSTYRKRYVSEGAAGFLDKLTEFEQLPDAIAAASQQPIRH
jgi:DNA-binding NarL/FixJ family response regulator